MKTLLEHIRKEMKTAFDLAGESPVCIGVSGGADSMALGHLIHQAFPEQKTMWVHVHHQLRGAEADEDAEFVTRVATDLGIPIRVVKVDTRSHMAEKKMSLEMAARELRYEVFQNAGASVVLTAHTLDDQVETVLMKWARGAAPGALAGIRSPVSRDGYTLIRPLLSIQRSELRDWLTDQGLTWREDSSNADEAMLRNRLRQRLLPVMEEVFGPQWMDMLARQTSIQGEEDDWFSAQVGSWLAGRETISVADLQREQPAFQRRVLHHWMLSEAGLPLQQVRWEQVQELMMSNEGSRGVDLEQGWRLERVYDELQLIAPSEKPASQELEIPGEISWGKGWLSCVEDVGYRRQPVGLPGTPSLAHVKRGKSPFRVRSWQPGDVIRISGMTGRKKLQDIFTDAKVPRHERKKIPLVCQGDTVIWIPGYGVHQDWRVADSESPSLRFEWRINP